MIEYNHKSQQKYSSRIWAVTGIILAVAFIVIIRLSSIQLFDSQGLKSYSQSQGFRTEDILPERGLILDRNGNVLADNIVVYNIGTRYIDLQKPESCFSYMAQIFGRSTEFYRNKFKQEKSFYVLETRISPELVAKIKNNPDCHGLKYDKIMSRYYPYKNAAGQVLGYINDQGEGKSGIEQYYDKILKGKKGKLVIQRDKGGNIITSQKSQSIPAVNGGKVHTTLDIEYQIILEEELAKTVESNKAKSGMGVIMDPKTGEVLAMANYPLFDANKLKYSTPEVRKNRVIMDQFEPGSIFKFLPIAAALEKNLFTPSSRIFCENGHWKVDKYTVHDTKEHDWLSLKEIMVYSSNIGAGKVGQKLGNQTLYDYSRKFGFGESTAIGLYGESNGLLEVPEKWSGVAYSQIPMGQGIAVSLMQMISAYSAVANGGILLKPYLVTKTFNEKNKVNSMAKVTPVRRAITKETSETLRTMMEAVVDSGTGKGAYIKGYHVAGKTGTAQKAENGKYSNQKYVASFMGFFPANDPVLVCGIVVDEPQWGRHHGATSAVPAVKNCFSRIINTPNFNTLYPQVAKKGYVPEVSQESKRNNHKEFTSLSMIYRSKGKESKDIIGQTETVDETETEAIDPSEYDVLMPNLKGMHVLNAEKKLRDFGLIVQKNASRGRVVSQEPKAGAYLKLGETCKLEAK